MLRWISAHAMYPLMDFRDGFPRLAMLDELQRSQWQPASLLAKQQQARLREIAGYADRHCAHYRNTFARVGFEARAFSLEAFESVPLLTKEDIRERTDELISDEFSKSDLPRNKTGGSTGVALTVYFDRLTRAWREAAAWRSDAWAGWTPGTTRAAVWGNPVAPEALKHQVRAWLYDRTFYLDTVRMTDSSMLAFFDEYQRRQPCVLFGHSHSIFVLAAFLRERHKKPTPPLGIISTSMMLIAPERQVIEEVFGCRVTDRYGCEEVGLIACECEQHDGQHLNVDHLYVEFVGADGRPVSPGEEGGIVVTDLLNRGMPLIRYALGDVGIPSDRRCPCGRGLPLVERIVGRTADFLIRADGGLVAGVSLIERTLTAIPGIKQMQLIQDSLAHLTVNVVPDRSYTLDTEQRLGFEFRRALGEAIAVEVCRVERIPQTSAGKYRFSICNVDRRSAAS
jgi:phenylacetate-CoA ligase